MPGRVVVVGLGPAGADLVVPAARDTFARIPTRFVRTRRHPAVLELERDGITAASFDDRYDEAADLGAVYAGIVDHLVAAAHERGEVAYAVPGNPAVAERTVALLREAEARGDVELVVHPGLSFAELAWSRLGVDPMDGARVVDGRDLALEPASFPGPLLIAQCDTILALADVKLALLDAFDPETPVTVLQRLGLPDESVRTTPLAELDRVVEPDHLTAVFVDGRGASATAEIVRLLELAERLRRPGGCPWDAEQTHHSLTRYLLEEAYEVVEAVEALPVGAPGGPTTPDAYRALEDELGDLLYQVVFHAVLAQEARAFTLGDVARGIHDKLVRRHPHVFGDDSHPMVGAASSADVMRNWEQIKKDEKGVTSIVDGITPGLPSLLYVHKLLRKAASVGLEPGSAGDALTRLDAAVARLRTVDDDGLEAALGALLAEAVVLARARGVDAESSLRGWAARFRARFAAMEDQAHEEGVDLTVLDPEAIAARWASAPH